MQSLISGSLSVDTFIPDTQRDHGSRRTLHPFDMAPSHVCRSRFFEKQSARQGG